MTGMSGMRCINAKLCSAVLALFIMAGANSVHAQAIQPISPPLPGEKAPQLDVPFGPTSLVLVDAMLRVANVGPQDFLIDLGSGDGRINIAAARERGARGAGYDLDPALVRASREFARIAGVADKVSFHATNLFDADLSPASVIAIYLGPAVTPRVAPKLLAELKPGTRVVSHNFGLGAWQPDLTVQPLGTGSARVLFWWVPAKVAGRWRASVDGAEYQFDFTQAFQEVDGSVSTPGAKIVLRDARLQGTRLRFLLQEQRGGEFRFRRFEGEVTENRIEGHVRNDMPPGEVPLRLERLSNAEPGPPGAWTFRR